jgi:hypothetical protein
MLGKDGTKPKTRRTWASFELLIEYLSLEQSPWRAQLMDRQIHGDLPICVEVSAGRGRSHTVFPIALVSDIHLRPSSIIAWFNDYFSQLVQ